MPRLRNQSRSFLWHKLSYDAPMRAGDCRWLGHTCCRLDIITALALTSSAALRRRSKGCRTQTATVPGDWLLIYLKPSSWIASESRATHCRLGQGPRSSCGILPPFNSSCRPANQASLVAKVSINTVTLYSCQTCWSLLLQTSPFRQRSYSPDCQAPFPYQQHEVDQRCKLRSPPARDWSIR